MSSPNLKLLLLLLALTLTACGTAVNLDAPVGESPLVIQASPQIVEASPTFAPRATATRAGTPTPDYAAQIGQSQLDLQQSLASATISALTQAPIQTSQAALQKNIDATSTATTTIGQTAEAHSVQTQSAIKTATVQAPITRRLQEQADWEPYWQLVLLGGTVGLLLLTAYCLVAVANQLIKLAYEKRLELHPHEPAPPGETVVQLDTWEKEFGESMQVPLPGTIEQMRALAEGIQAGRPLAFTHWIGSDRPFSRGEFEQLRYRLVEFGFAEYTDPTNRASPIHLTEAGRQLLSKFSEN